jgi:hypothetical protein
MRHTCRSLRRQAGIGKPSNIAVEQSAGAHSPATAAHRRRSTDKMPRSVLIP